MNQRLESTIAQLLTFYPKLDIVELEESDSIPTIAVTKERFRFNQKFVESLTDEELYNTVISLAKKIDLYDDYTKSQNKPAFNMAADIAIGFELERQHLKLPTESLHNFYPQYNNKNLDEIYSDLVSKMRA